MDVPYFLGTSSPQPTDWPKDSRTSHHRNLCQTICQIQKSKVLHGLCKRASFMIFFDRSVGRSFVRSERYEYAKVSKEICIYVSLFLFACFISPFILKYKWQLLISALKRTNGRTMGTLARLRQQQMNWNCRKARKTAEKNNKVCKKRWCTISE